MPWRQVAARSGPYTTAPEPTAALNPGSRVTVSPPHRSVKGTRASAITSSPGCCPRQEIPWQRQCDGQLADKGANLRPGQAAPQHSIRTRRRLGTAQASDCPDLAMSLPRAVASHCHHNDRLHSHDAAPAMSRHYGRLAVLHVGRAATAKAHGWIARTAERSRIADIRTFLSPSLPRSRPARHLARSSHPAPDPAVSAT